MSGRRYFHLRRRWQAPVELSEVKDNERENLICARELPEPMGYEKIRVGGLGKFLPSREQRMVVEANGERTFYSLSRLTPHESVLGGETFPNDRERRTLNLLNEVVTTGGVYLRMDPKSKKSIAWKNFPSRPVTSSDRDSWQEIAANLALFPDSELKGLSSILRGVVKDPRKLSNWIGIPAKEMDAGVGRLSALVGRVREAKRVYGPDNALGPRDLAKQLRGLGSRDGEMRLDASRRLFRHYQFFCSVLDPVGGESALPALTTALKDDQERVRQNAAMTLGYIGSNRAIDPMIDALDQSRSEEDELELMTALSLFDNPRVLPAFLDRLDDPKKRVRSRAVISLAYMSEFDSFGDSHRRLISDRLIERGAREPDEGVRSKISEAILHSQRRMER